MVKLGELSKDFCLDCGRAYSLCDCEKITGLCLHCGLPVRGLKTAPEIAIHFFSEERQCASKTFADFDPDYKYDIFKGRIVRRDE